MNKNIPILSISIAIIILLRCLFDNHEKIVYIVAGINIVAIIYVIYTIIEKIVNNIAGRLRKSGAPEQILNRELKNTRNRIWKYSIGINIILIILYFGLWCSGLGNDIISIIALGISVLDDEIVKIISDNYKI